VRTIDRTLRTPPQARRSPLDGVVVSVLERVLSGIEGGTLVVVLPDGTERRFGTGPEQTLAIRDARLFRRLATRPKLALGEAYQAGEWTTDDLAGVLELLMRNAVAGGERHSILRRMADLRPRLNRRTGLLAARRNIAYHYDLGNELFASFLDETMTYSCAVFADEDEPLADAQRRKLRSVCEKLELDERDHVLEIGCGWGSFALTAAGEYGARVTAVTISAAQARLARERVRAAGLDDRVEIVERDFRELDGTYTKIASIEMLEAVGERLWQPFFAACDRLLAPGGRVCVQVILVPDERFARYRRSPDWIERYVFPGGLIPSLGALRGAWREASALELRGVEEIGSHYATTLRAWRERFHARIDDVRRLGYDERFVRTWDFYLASCEALFGVGLMRDAQLVLGR
jgi:cyclopropane-fatty-acyl-phospholipid synthase